MKQSPSQRQFEYLQSIGALNDSHRRIVQGQEQRSQITLEDVFNRSKWWLLALLCIVILLAAASVTYATDYNADTTDRPSATEDKKAIHSDSGVTGSKMASIHALPNEEKTDKGASDNTLIILMFIAVLFAASSGVNWLIVRYLITVIQRIAISMTPLPLSRFRDDKSSNPSSAKPKKYVHRLTQSEVPSPEQLIQVLSDFPISAPLLQAPTRPTDSWSLGFATHPGNVRKENQDYVICFQLGKYDALICADGLGGLPKGQQASFLAVFETAKSIIQQLGAISWKPIQPKKVIKKALSQAHHILTAYGDKLSISDINGGLRTTLIIALANATDVHYGYIGDGGLDILRSTGHLESLMTPHKHGQLLNVLSASLGPEKQGDAVIGQIERRPGDLLIVSTDGIADRIDAPEFARDIMRLAIHKKGDLHAVAKQVVEELANSKDDHGYICDDNLTLALLGTGYTPVLASGFWNERPSAARESVLDSETDEDNESTLSAVEGAST